MSVNPYQSLAANIAAWIKSKTHLSVQAWGFDTLAPLPLVQNATLGAGLTGTTIGGSVVLPQAMKIPKVAFAYETSDLFNGTETLQIVVESSGDYNPAASTPNAAFNTSATPFGQGVGVAHVLHTAGQGQMVGPGDNSGLIGYPTQFAAAGDCLFATDVPIDAATFTNASAGTGGGSCVQPTTNWDTVYAAGTVLSLRGVTTASTGSITGLCVTLLTQTVDQKPANDRAIPCYSW
jgi:hypothetical protein